MKIGQTLAAFAAALLLMASPRAEALAVFCVSDGAELQAVLAAAEPINDNVDIRLRAGTFTTSGSPFVLAMRDGYNRGISGGWTGASGQCASQVADPTLSRLDGGGATSVLTVQQQGSAGSGAAFVSNLTFANGFATNGAAGCVHVDLQIGSPLVQFDRTILRDCRHGGALGRGGAMRLQLDTGAFVLVRNSLLTANQATGAGAIAVVTRNLNAQVELNNNTIVANSASDAAGAGGVERPQYAILSGRLAMRNNAVVGNTAGGVPSDLAFFGNALDYLLVNNAVQQFNGLSDAAAGTVAADATVFRAFGADYRLRPGSALRNAGTTLLAYQSGNHDLDGEARVQQGAIDIGAYEDDGVFDSSFESP